MSNLNIVTELQRFSESKQLAEVNLLGDDQFKACYILSANEEFVTVADINPAATHSLVTICRLNDIQSVKVETLYHQAFSPQITDDTLHQQATDLVKNVQEFTFEGFISAFEKTNTIVSLSTDEDDSLAGRIIDHSSEVVLLDEFYSEYSQRFARTYINTESINQIIIGAPWLNTIARTLATKNL